MIEIYEQEKIDNLSDKLQCLSFAYTLNISESPIVSFSTPSAMANLLEQPDLYYIDSILATLGWNLNDDIFLREEVVAAKSTPVDKPFNKMHNQDEIIGHMISSRLLDSEYKESTDDLFEHIAVSSVIYKAWRDETKKEEILKTIAEIQEGKWKVSMECLFDKFDYGIITADGKQMIVKRTPETSYLTKHLRAYGGTGVYQGNKVGRVLRNITFCGKGLVDNPGNPYSIIFNKNKKFFGAVASINYLKENLMNEELEKVKEELVSAKTALAELKTSHAKEVETKLNQAISERDSTIAALRNDLNITVAKLAENGEKLNASQTVIAELTVNLEKAVAEMNALNLAQTILKRRSALAGIVSPERVEALMANIGNLPEAAFNSVVESLAEFKPMEGKDKEDKSKEDCASKDGCKADFSKANLEETINTPNEFSTAAQKKFEEADNKIVNFLRNKIDSRQNKQDKKGDK